MNNLGHDRHAYFSQQATHIREIRVSSHQTSFNAEPVDLFTIFVGCWGVYVHSVWVVGTRGASSSGPNLGHPPIKYHSEEEVEQLIN